MPVPEKLKNTSTAHSVFLYCTSLNGQANDLANLLGESEFWKSWVAKDCGAAAARRAPIVWLVGHGLSDKSAMLDEHRNVVVPMDEVVDWCHNYGVQDVVDTACFPKSRLATVLASKPRFSYYCKRSDVGALSLGDYQGNEHPPTMAHLDAWWDGEQYHCASAPPAAGEGWCTIL